MDGIVDILVKVIPNFDHLKDQVEIVVKATPLFGNSNFLLLGACCLFFLIMMMGAEK
jgi:hypothetical protein